MKIRVQGNSGTGTVGRECGVQGRGLGGRLRRALQVGRFFRGQTLFFHRDRTGCLLRLKGSRSRWGSPGERLSWGGTLIGKEEEAIAKHCWASYMCMSLSRPAGAVLP